MRTCADFAACAGAGADIARLIAAIVDHIAFSTESFAQEMMAAALVLFGTAGSSGVSGFETATVVHGYRPGPQSVR
jgi:hypothetical protein